MNNLTALHKMAIAIVLVLVGGFLMTLVMALGETAHLTDVIVASCLWVGGIVIGLRAIWKSWKSLREVKREKNLRKLVPPLFPE